MIQSGLNKNFLFYGLLIFGSVCIPQTPSSRASTTAGTSSPPSSTFTEQGRFSDCGESCIKNRARTQFSLHQLYLTRKIQALDAIRKNSSKSDFERAVQANLQNFCSGAGLASDMSRCFDVYRIIHKEQILPKMKQANAKLKKDIAELRDSRQPVAGAVLRWQDRLIPRVSSGAAANTGPSSPRLAQMPEIPTSAELTQQYKNEYNDLKKTIQPDQTALIQDLIGTPFAPSIEEYVIFEEHEVSGRKVDVLRKNCNGLPGCVCLADQGFCYDKSRFEKDLAHYRAAQSVNHPKLQAAVTWISHQDVATSTPRAPGSTRKGASPQNLFGKISVKAYRQARKPLVAEVIKLVQSHAIPSNSKTVDLSAPGDAKGKLNSDLTGVFTQSFSGANSAETQEESIPELPATAEVDQISVSISPEEAQRLIQEL